MAPLGCARLAELLCFPKCSYFLSLISSVKWDQTTSSFLRSTGCWSGWLCIRKQGCKSRCWYLLPPINLAWWGVMSATDTPFPFWNFPLWKTVSCFHVVLIWVVQHPTDFCHFTLSPDADYNSRQLWKNICVSACLPHWASLNHTKSTH